jgi:uncharacterized protein DUF2784
MTSRFFQMGADAVVVLHFCFVLFVLLGGLLVLRWPWLIWAHVPAAIWGIVIEFGGWICPLTPLENHWRQRGGSAGYHGDFVEHYILPVLYPAGLTRNWQLALGAIALAANALVYGFILRHRHGVKMHR